MALPIWQRTITDNQGNVIPGAEVLVVNEATGLNADIFSNRSGTTPLTNPFFTGTDGFAQFYADPGEYRIEATGPTGSIVWRWNVLTGDAALRTVGTAAGEVPTNGDLGTMSTQDADDVNITGGDIAGVNVSNLARTDAAQTFTGRQTFSGTDGIVIPVGTTAQRSGSPAVGLARLNTTLGIMEYYDGTVWRGFGEQFIEIGTPMGGGYFAGYISTSADGVPTHYLIVAPKATGENLSIAYGPTGRSDPTSLIDGPANTATLVATGDAPAAQFCAGLTIGGFTDWYMPARYELDVLYFSLKPTTASNRDDGANSAGVNPNAVPRRNAFFTAVGPPRQTTAAQFRDGNSEAFVAGTYWSSSQANTSNAWRQLFDDGDVASRNKTVLFRVRAVRRIAI